MIGESLIINGDCLEKLKELPDKIVDCCVTSPPYYGLRDYGMSEQIGLEETPEEYIDKLVQVFGEVKRVLKDDGTLWVNIGDSYVSKPKSNYDGKGAGINDKAYGTGDTLLGYKCQADRFKKMLQKYKNKDLIGIPWMLAFALRNDGWYLRQDIIWSKPNPMPESVKDRCTKSHEYIFLLSKQPHYYFDNEAIREKGVMTRNDSAGSRQQDTRNTHRIGGGNSGISLAKEKLAKELSEKGYSTRNKRDVWSVTTKAIKEAHFATFPEELIKPCILAGSRANGIVLDPFFGSGTTGRVATELNRKYIGIELNPEYVEIAGRRTNNVQLSLF